MKKPLLFIIVLLFSATLFGCINSEKAAPRDKGGIPPSKLEQNNNSNDNAAANEEANSTVYKNTEYGFSFSLPESWKDYSIITEKWEGLAIGGAKGEEVVEAGPMISIRHPEWTSEKPRQDIPIMIFTISQWNLLKQEKFHIGAAPVGPSELARNTEYVFALPARYNFAFLTGYEEVENILTGNPLQPMEK